MTRIETSPWTPIDGTADQPVLALGDIHGNIALMRAAAAHLAAIAEPGDQLVLLGDLIDRGDDSVACLDLARRLVTDGAVAIAGNHEEMLLATLNGDPRAGRLWHMNGGEAVIDELGVRENAPFADWSAELADALGPDRMAFLRGLSAWWRTGDVLCVHAGIDPGQKVADQLAEPIAGGRIGDAAIRWVRHPFLRHEGPIEDVRFVLFGHTPMRHRPLLTASKLGLDLGGFATGRVGIGEVRGNQARYHIVDAGHRP